MHAEDSCSREEMAHCGGRDPDPERQRWLAHRYNVSFRCRVFRAGAFSDTIEVATTWDRLLPLYRGLRAAVAPHALIMAHFSHVTRRLFDHFTISGWRRNGSLLLPASESGPRPWLPIRHATTPSGRPRCGRRCRLGRRSVTTTAWDA